MPPEDLAEIDRLWANAESASAASAEASASLPAGPAGGEEAWEAVRLLKRQRRRERRAWTELLEAKERALEAVRERQALLERQLMELRRQGRVQESWVLEKTLEAQAGIGEAAEDLARERARHLEQERALAALAEQARGRLKSLEGRLEQEKQEREKREQRALSELARAQAGLGRFKEEAERAQGSLRQARDALEKTLAELLRERRLREECQRQREGALARAAEIEHHLQELSRLWEEERSRWKLLQEPLPIQPGRPGKREAGAQGDFWRHALAWVLAAGSAFLLARIFYGP